MDSSGSEFGSMLQQVSTLQGDLSKALGVCRDLRSENDVVVRNYEKVRAFVLAHSGGGGGYSQWSPHLRCSLLGCISWPVAIACVLAVWFHDTVWHWVGPRVHVLVLRNVLCVAMCACVGGSCGAGGDSGDGGNGQTAAEGDAHPCVHQVVWQWCVCGESCGESCGAVMQVCICWQQ